MKFCHTIEDAKSKVCPMALGDPETASLCEADHCMAWRWAETHIKNPENPEGELIKSSTSHGFCGMGIHPLTDPRR